MPTTQQLQQFAISDDYLEYVSKFPNLKKALQTSLKEVVRERPTDPFLFMAECLRKCNIEFQMEDLGKEDAAVKIQQQGRAMRDRKRVKELKEQRKQQQAAVKIQAQGRRVRDRQLAENKRVANQIWLRELFSKLCRRKVKTVLVSDLWAYLRSDPDVMLELAVPIRFTLPSMPQQYQIIVDVVLDRLPEDMSKQLQWVEVANLFGMDLERARQVDQQHAAVKIQAVQRGRRDCERVRQLRNSKANKADSDATPSAKDLAESSVSTLASNVDLGTPRDEDDVTVGGEESPTSPLRGEDSVIIEGEEQAEGGEAEEEEGQENEPF